jgi:membrane-associated protease RseP (regulator of RpoE activity)
MRKEHRTILIQVVLFITTFITTTMAGAEWVYGKSILTERDARIVLNTGYTWSDFLSGLEFSVPFLLFLTVHEFGHYFTARAHKIRATLPFYLPFPPMFPPSIGTFGAVIRIKDKVRTNLEHFDIGFSGPLAGFIIGFATLWYGYANLPPAEYVFQFHPEYEQYGLNYADHVYKPDSTRMSVDYRLGSSLLVKFFETVVADPARLPNPHEMVHYPLLVAGFLALFFTCLNLLPIGQLDGGHVIYGLFGWKKHKIIASVFFLLLVSYSGLGLVSPTDGADTLMWSVPIMVAYYYLCFGGFKLATQDQLMYALLMFAAQFLIAWGFPGVKGSPIYLLFGFIVGRFVGIGHPPSEIEQPLDTKRTIVGWITLIIFIICFSPNPLEIVVTGGK